jgi:hypothetical protein
MTYDEAEKILDTMNVGWCEMDFEGRRAQLDGTFTSLQLQAISMLLAESPLSRSVRSTYTPQPDEDHDVISFGPNLAPMTMWSGNRDIVSVQAISPTAISVQFAERAEDLMITYSPPLMRCAASRDGECSHAQCPQQRDGEPRATGRHCPLDNQTEEDA